MLLWCAALLCGLSAAELCAEPRLGFRPYIRAYGVYDTNIFLTPDSDPAGATADFIPLVSPGFDAAYLLRIGDLSAGYNLNFHAPLQNIDNASLDTLTHSAYFSLLTRLSSRFELELRDSLQILATDITRPGYQISNTTQVNALSLEARYVLPLSQRSTAKLGLQGSRTQVFDFNSDRYSESLEFSLDRELTPRLKAGIQSSIAMIQFDAAPLQDVILYTVRMFAEYEISPRWRIALPAGAQYIQQENTGGDWGGNFDVKLSGEPTARTQMALAFRQGFAVDIAGEAVESWEVLLSHVWELSPRWKMESSLRYNQFTLNSLSPDPDTVMEGSLAFNYELSANLLGTLGTRAFFNRGELEDNDFDSLQGYLGLTYEFNKN